MIAANELRIGNFVLAKPIFGNDKKFKPLQIASPNEIFRCYNTPKDFNPIPLTPEILEKCGFVVVHKANNHYTINDPNGFKDSHKIAIFHTVNNQWHIAFSDTFSGYKDYIPTTKIKYLHQLQNLYFALTGEELTVKL
jgi:hypothetical protein